MKVKTAELLGAALDWAAAIAGGHTPKHQTDFVTLSTITYVADWDIAREYTPSTDWEQGGLIIQCEKLDIKWVGANNCRASNIWFGVGHAEAYGSTPLIAGMRCYVLAKLGKEVEIPDDL